MMYRNAEAFMPFIAWKVIDFLQQHDYAAG